MNATCDYCEQPKSETELTPRNGTPCCRECHDYLDNDPALKALIRLGAKELAKGKMYGKRK